MSESAVAPAKAVKKKTNFLAAFAPNVILSAGALRIVIIFQIILAVLVWSNSKFEVLPTPVEVLNAFQKLWFKDALALELITSFKLIIHALTLSTLFSLALSYLTVMPFFRPLAHAISKMRYLSLVGFSFAFTVMGAGGYNLKLWMLVFGMTVFFLTSMAATVAAIPKETFDHARTLRMSEWRVVWEVVIVGTADQAFEVMRQNAAIGWLMLTLVEGIVRADGGLGVMLLNAQKYLRMDEIYAIQITILLVALTQDYVIGMIRRLCCPYADLTMERKTS